MVKLTTKCRQVVVTALKCHLPLLLIFFTLAATIYFAGIAGASALAVFRSQEQLKRTIDSLQKDAVAFRILALRFSGYQ